MSIETVASPLFRSKRLIQDSASTDIVARDKESLESVKKRSCLLFVTGFPMQPMDSDHCP